MNMTMNDSSSSSSSETRWSSTHESIGSICDDQIQQSSAGCRGRTRRPGKLSRGRRRNTFLSDLLLQQPLAIVDDTKQLPPVSIMELKRRHSADGTVHRRRRNAARRAKKSCVHDASNKPQRSISCQPFTVSNDQPGIAEGDSMARLSSALMDEFLHQSRWSAEPATRQRHSMPKGLMADIAASMMSEVSAAENDLAASTSTTTTRNNIDINSSVNSNEHEESDAGSDAMRSITTFKDDSMPRLPIRRRSVECNTGDVDMEISDNDQSPSHNQPQGQDHGPQTTSPIAPPPLYYATPKHAKPAQRTRSVNRHRLMAALTQAISISESTKCVPFSLPSSPLVSLSPSARPRLCLDSRSTSRSTLKLSKSV
eukprot:CAMPEP_0198110738 /NCGR_PEP_ID=MMETSP1442-20131203/2738_1 /TAXON_ID= /ORGANISM="Craspedostauros australis, Strain CCMP3328" /LENGTH=368 /DNA_ID=CAMNT_0043766913 /DNA_START=301 /DNA_END=1407 /DNA_ORIENTATION=-